MRLILQRAFRSKEVCYKMREGVLNDVGCKTLLEIELQRKETTEWQDRSTQEPFKEMII